MPLLEMSPNIQETELAGRKRSHEEFADESIKIESSDNKGPVTGPIQQSSACCKPSLFASVTAIH